MGRRARVSVWCASESESGDRTAGLDPAPVCLSVCGCARAECRSGGPRCSRDPVLTAGLRQVEVKRAEPREANKAVDGQPMQMAPADGWRPPQEPAAHWGMPAVPVRARSGRPLRRDADGGRGGLVLVVWAQDWLLGFIFLIQWEWKRLLFFCLEYAVAMCERAAVTPHCCPCRVSGV